MANAFQQAVAEEIASLEQKRDHYLEQAKLTQASIDGLLGVRRRLGRTTANDKPIRPAKRSSKGAATDCILDYLTEHPDSLALEVIDALEEMVSSKAKNKRHSLRTTLFNLDKRGKLRRDPKTKRYSVIAE